MSDFLTDLTQHRFLQLALAAGVLASISCGIIGTYVVTRRITYIAGSIAHCVLGGFGAAAYVRAVTGWTWLAPIYGAILTALLAAAIIALISLKMKEREDTVIGALWAIGMAAGILFIRLTPGYQVDPVSYLFGDILLVSSIDVTMLVILDLALLVIAVLLHNRFVAICFDEEFARLRGVRVDAYYLLLLVLTALTVVLLVKVAGIVMVIALLTLPVAVGSFFARTLGQIMIVATLLSMAFTTGGLALSYGPNLPPGAVIILLAGVVYLLVTVGAALLRRARAHA